ncbi:MAG TPA: hypothetical protein VF092_19780 [Longimicrobium sp.]
MTARAGVDPASPPAELWRSRGRLLVPGGALAVLGAFSVLLAAATPFFSLGVFGRLLVLAGVVETAQGLRLWRSGWAGVVPALVAGVLYLVCGVLVTAGGPAPVAAVTLTMAAVLIAGGALRLLWPLRAAVPGRRASAAHGAVTLLLGLGLWAVRPANSLSPVGLFVGGDLLASGAMLLFLARTARRFAPSGP